MEEERQLIYRQIGAKIAYYRTIRGLSQVELARRVSMSVSTVSKIERGKYNNGLAVATLMDIAEGLQIEMVSLLSFSAQERRILQETLTAQ